MMCYYLNVRFQGQRVKILKLLIVSNIDYNVFKLRHESGKYIKNAVLLASGNELHVGLRNVRLSQRFC